MALTDIALAYIPPPQDSAWLASFFDLDAQNEQCAAILDVPKTGAIRKVGFAVDQVTVSGAADVRIETISAGLPTGTLWGTNTNVAHTVSATGWQVTSALTSDASVTRGDRIAVVIKNNSASADFRIENVSNGPWSSSRYPYGAQDLGGAGWSKVSVTPALYLEYSDASQERIIGVPVFINPGLATFNSGSAEDEIGNRMVLAYGCRTQGAWILADIEQTSDVVLYEGTTQLASCTLSPDERGATSVGLYYCLWDAAQELTASTVYRVVLKPSTTTPNTAIYTGSVSSAQLALLPGGANVYKTGRADAGSWSDDSSTITAIGLIIDQIDLGGGSGGAIVNQGLHAIETGITA